jgi:hypothetical protein
VFVRGNGDRWVVDAFDAPGSMSGGDERPGRPWAAWTAGAIDRRDRDLLASFAERRRPAGLVVRSLEVPIARVCTAELAAV